MTKKADRFSDWIPANEAARILSEKMDFPIEPAYITKLARSKKQPVKTRAVSGHLLYFKADIERCTVKKRQTKQE